MCLRLGAISQAAHSPLPVSLIQVSSGQATSWTAGTAPYCRVQLASQGADHCLPAAHWDGRGAQECPPFDPVSVDPAFWSGVTKPVLLQSSSGEHPEFISTQLMSIAMY